MTWRTAKGFVAKTLTTSALALGITSAAQATILPPNNLHLEDNLEMDSALTEADFNQVISFAESYYRPLAKQKGANLIIRRNWTNSTVNASAMRQGTTWYVDMYGGLARRPEITKDGFALVLCHELGHHLAGYPFVSGWAANEGQSDYYGAQACLRTLWKNQNAQNQIARSTVDMAARTQCDRVWRSTTDQNLCYRIAMAGRSLAELLAYGARVSFSTPDRNVVSRTYHNHPAAQCRLDTYMAGAICPTNFPMNQIPMSSSAAYSTSCGPQSTTGQRPRCWFSPNG